jgi:hypothetical protein
MKQVTLLILSILLIVVSCACIGPIENAKIYTTKKHIGLVRKQDDEEISVDDDNFEGMKCLQDKVFKHALSRLYKLEKKCGYLSN